VNVESSFASDHVSHHTESLEIRGIKRNKKIKFNDEQKASFRLETVLHVFPQHLRDEEITT
jgi:hypothetical protein